MRQSRIVTAAHNVHCGDARTSEVARTSKTCITAEVASAMLRRWVRNYDPRTPGAAYADLRFFVFFLLAAFRRAATSSWILYGSSSSLPNTMKSIGNR